MASHQLINLSNSSTTLLSPFGTHSGVDITIQNVNTEGYVYIGANSQVSSTNYGYRISPNSAVSFELPGSDALYAIGSTTGLKVAVMITNLDSGA
jgi:hypothetical protein